MFRHVSFFVSGASVPCLQQIADQTRNRKEKRDYESGDTEGTLRGRASGPVQCREPTSVAEDGQRLFSVVRPNAAQFLFVYRAVFCDLQLALNLSNKSPHNLTSSTNSISHLNPI